MLLRRARFDLVGTGGQSILKVAVGCSDDAQLRK
jgi:hypothetical protein